MAWWIGLFGGEDAWQRENPRVGRMDWLVFAFWLIIQLATLELMGSYVDFGADRRRWAEYAIALVSAIPLLLRRRFPIVSALGSFALFFVATTWLPFLGYNQIFQITMFLSMYSMVAWGRDRVHTALASAVIGLLTALWLAWDLALGTGMDAVLKRASEQRVHGLLPPGLAWALMMVLINILYFVGAFGVGQSSWIRARDAARLRQSLATVEAQSVQLTDQAVVDERLRIARELHDVVAHHVSVMGIQASAARRLLQSKPEQATAALENVEASAREAVTQMRGLLGALRATGPEEDRGPQPTLAELEALVDDFARHGIHVTLTRTEPTPGALAALPLPLQLTLYRTVQEALANVVKHSTARTASVALRLLAHEVEAEILDDGRSRVGTGGTGLGQAGMRERVASHGGTCEIGARVVGGYRVRVRLPHTLAEEIA